MPPAPLIIHAVLAIVGIRLGLYSFMAWKRLRLKHAIASTAPAGLERLFLVLLPVVAALMAAMVLNSGVAVIGLLAGSTP
ncbi:MAG: hypothetical protein ABL989_08850 [Gammaproteobacteria bacterium]